MSGEDEKTLSRIISGSTIVLIGSIFNKILSFGGSVFIARLLGDAGYGSIVLSLSVYFILCNVLTLGLGGGIARNYQQVETDIERRGILVSAFRIGSITGLIGGLVIFLAADYIALYTFNDPSVSSLLRILAVALPMKVLLNLSNGTFQALRKPKLKAVIASIVQPAIRMFSLLVLVLAGYEAAGAVGAYTVTTGTAAVISIYYVYRYSSLFDLGQKVQTSYRSLLNFSLPLVGSTVLVDLMNNLDTLLIGSLAASADVGQYNVAFVLGQTTLLFLQTLGFMYLPEISELHSDNRVERANMVYRAITKWVLFISIPFILTAVSFPAYTVTFIYSDQYATASVPFVILITGFVTHILNGPNHATLTAFGNTRQIFVFDIITMILNIMLNLSLIPRFGITGAATATATAYLVRNTAMTWYLNRVYDIQPFSRWLLTPLVPVIFVAGVLRWLVSEPSLLIVISYALILTVTIALGYLSSGIEKADLILSELIENKTGVNLKLIKRTHKIFN
jgi:O-antigen/teichoic acid export membrane protein